MSEIVLAAAAPFRHQHAAHCESGVITNLLRHHGASVSEPLAFGVSAALSFAYLPFIKINGMPLVSYRMPPKAIIKGVAAPFAASFRFERFARQEEGERRLDELLAQGRVVGLQTSVYWLPYFPEDMRFHFNAHNLLVYGREGDEYLVSDPVTELPVRCARADLTRARFAKGVLAPKGLLYYPEKLGRKEISADAVRNAIRKTRRIMHAPIPLIGVKGMRTLASRIQRLAQDAPASSQYVGHIVRMQEEIGTGGAGFRFLYAAFLQEAAALCSRPSLNEFAERLLGIGDAWRDFALAAARMVKGRDRFDPPAIAALLRQQAAQEDAFFQDLGRVFAKTNA